MKYWANKKYTERQNFLQENSGMIEHKNSGQIVLENHGGIESLNPSLLEFENIRLIEPGYIA